MKKLILGDLHREEAPAFSEAWGIELPRSYCDEPGSEHAALQDSVGLLDESYRGVLDFTGADAAAFLDTIPACCRRKVACSGPSPSTAWGHRIFGQCSVNRSGRRCLKASASMLS